MDVARQKTGERAPPPVPAAAARRPPLSATTPRGGGGGGAGRGLGGKGGQGLSNPTSKPPSNFNVRKKLKTSPSSPECEDHVNGIIAKICTLLEEYTLESDDDHGQPSSSFSSLEAPTLMSLFNARGAQKRTTSFRMKSELDRYLEDELVPLSNDKFSVLDWWKVSGTRYPTLRLLARDVFATPVSTVASESTFSTSGRVLSDNRSRLTPEILEALMCSQDWIRNKYKDADNEDGQRFWSCLQDIQEGMRDLAL